MPVIQMSNSRFTKPKGLKHEPTPYLFIANCGPAVGIPFENIESAFSIFGKVIGVHAADETGARVIVCFSEVNAAEAAIKMLNGCPCAELGGRTLHIRYSAIQPPQKQPIAFAYVRDVMQLHMDRLPKALELQVHGDNVLPVSFLASDLDIPGIYLVHDFITLEEEQELLAEVDNRKWINLAKRRVQHYGYEFLYKVNCFLSTYVSPQLRYFSFVKPDSSFWNCLHVKPVLVYSGFISWTRNVDSKQFLGELPYFVSNILQKIASFPGLVDDQNKEMDQLTVNEYPCGVGLSPHIDTHSAFDELIFSLSVAGSCIMEFRRYPLGTWQFPSASVDEINEDSTLLSSNTIRKAIFLPSRSMLLMSGEGRYAWNHYIPHHKVDIIGDKQIRRSSRRVSFTFRKVRQGPCRCAYKQYCDSQQQCRDQQLNSVELFHP
ncbi:hypothetical protein ZIOFF_061326 [Zingiber officinale]|uniref:RNA-binding (RRM/RBD/RNP motifs) family protein n=1 Tax=Zingiber officinale TaxID=94328 RepID=A0A8J5F3V6_ZINOF|nr:hypothetical protein ZIOFF_061326 [Zingiber officinale]